MEFREPPHINPTLNEPRRIVLLGSTGSIGTQAIDVADAAPERFRIVALTGGSNLELLARQAVHTRAGVVALADGDVDELRARIHEHAELAGHSAYHPELLAGPTAAARVAGYPEADVVLNGVTGSIGLAPTLAALKAGHLLALANKESLIAGGALVKQAAAPGQLVPVDSEHSAIAQALRAGTPEEVARLIVTASGGPFRGMTRQQLMDVTPAQALDHPTWEMGKVVSTNSATMVNKALEVIEAHLLFDVPLQKIEAVVHPQSMVHSMVEFIDGSTIAQASPPDMRLPIALGMGWPARVPGAAAPCDFTTASSWSFEPLDEEAFPAIRLAKQAANTSATHMAVYNAANEEAVEAFHAGRIRFPDIVDCVADVVGQYDAGALVGDELSVQSVLVAEAWARKCAQERWGQL
ncbi:1-deoxy-D-xylulose-5-phosphate reductoisomerase [Glutamicibacter sp. BW78]|uniref:1-deoxy-D-xylulose-5-phosphate reductoisomerase n=1 Tax=Glutamicibacter sp. BW78 TaxID=2024403 RepID=UPI000BB72300|nr:1-deoxy-D-xylulose-5-phosphate reductoisomerase [Glutamicibacter sp. BW78]PCC26799.1 1-deoxy-D-xylulose-5-phosphate reductoisomerase [Glutamicibacter sp. BW78]